MTLCNIVARTSYLDFHVYVVTHLFADQNWIRLNQKQISNYSPISEIDDPLIELELLQWLWMFWGSDDRSILSRFHFEILRQHICMYSALVMVTTWTSIIIPVSHVNAHVIANHKIVLLEHVLQYRLLEYFNIKHIYCYYWTKTEHVYNNKNISWSHRSSNHSSNSFGSIFWENQHRQPINSARTPCGSARHSYNRFCPPALQRTSEHATPVSSRSYKSRSPPPTKTVLLELINASLPRTSPSAAVRCSLSLSSPSPQLSSRLVSNGRGGSMRDPCA